MIQPQWLAQGDGEEWVNILFIVAVAVFWAVGGLIKAASARKTTSQSQRQGRQKPADGQRRESWQQRLARKAEEIQQAAGEHLRRIEEQAGARAQPRQTPGHGQPDQGRVTVRAGRGGEPVLVYERMEGREGIKERQRRAARPYQEQQAEARRLQKQQIETAKRSLHAETPQSQPRPDSVSDASAGKMQRPQPPDFTEPMPKQTQEPAYPASPLIDYSDTDALKRAILHYEILGKPLSLRDPFEHASGF